MPTPRKLERLKKAQRTKALDCEQMVFQIHEYAEYIWGDGGMVHHADDHWAVQSVVAPTLKELLDYVRDIATRERV